LTIELAPDNYRDKVLKITKKGQRWRKLAAQQIMSIEANCADVIGKSGTETLRKHLIELVNKTKHSK